MSKLVLKQFDYEQIFYVLANVIRQKDWNGKPFSNSLKTFVFSPVLRYNKNERGDMQ